MQSEEGEKEALNPQGNSPIIAKKDSAVSPVGSPIPDHKSPIMRKFRKTIPRKPTGIKRDPGVDLDENDSGPELRTHDIENQINALTSKKVQKSAKKVRIAENVGTNDDGSVIRKGDVEEGGIMSVINSPGIRTSIDHSVDRSMDQIDNIIQAPITCLGLCLRYDTALISMVTFGFQALLGFVVLLFCIGQLASGSVTSTEQTIYFTLIGSIIGYFLPNPKLDTSGIAQITSASALQRTSNLHS